MAFNASEISTRRSVCEVRTMSTH